MPLTSDFQIHGVLANYWGGFQSPLPTFHRHNEIELNLLTRGRMTYNIAGQTIQMPMNTLCVFWAGFSHRLLDWEPNGEIWSLAIPLTQFLRWPLPQETFVHPLMHGNLLMETDASMSASDVDLFRRWHRDLNTSTQSEQREIVVLELEARLRRMAAHVGTAPASGQHGSEAERVARMLQYIAGNYSRRITVTEIARAANTNPSYAMELFKRSCGISVMQYVNDQRVAHARRMLATSQAKILDIARDAGFGSLSQFHNVFRKISGQSPRQYTRAMQLS